LPVIVADKCFSTIFLAHRVHIRGRQQDAKALLGAANKLHFGWKGHQLTFVGLTPAAQPAAFLSGRLSVLGGIEADHRVMTYAHWMEARRFSTE
jgi:hypothetical protein